MFKNVIKLMLFLVLVASCASSPKKKNPNFLGDFDAIQLPQIMMASVSRINSSLKPKNISFVFEPKTNIVSFHHRYLGDNIWIALNYENRQALIEAINKYLNAFQDRSLVSANNKKKAFFGKTTVFMSWGLLAVAHTAKPDLRFEYQLFGEKKLPYFILATRTQSALGKDSANSPAIRLALSPAKCQDLLKRLEQENLVKIVADMEKEFNEYEPVPFNIDETENEQSIAPDEASFDF